MTELDVLARARQIAHEHGSFTIQRSHLRQAERELGVTVKVQS